MPSRAPWLSHANLAVSLTLLTASACTAVIRRDAAVDDVAADQRTADVVISTDSSADSDVFADTLGSEPDAVEIAADVLDADVPEAGRVDASTDASSAEAGDAAVCAPGALFCSGACTSVEADDSHCGACNNRCPAATICNAGRCIPFCPVGFLRCPSPSGGEVCANPSSDRSHCGRCGNTCAAGLFCIDSRCEVSCPAGQATCTNQCAVLASDPANCGRCGAACPSVANASAVCSSGTCSSLCRTGFADCDAVPGNGCETSLATNSRNCGRCGNICTFANASAICASSTCGLGACNGGFANCDGSVANGCEINVTNNNSHCGGCGVVCGSGTTCVDSRCSVFSASVAPVTVAMGCSLGLEALNQKIAISDSNRILVALSCAGSGIRIATSSDGGRSWGLITTPVTSNTGPFALVHQRATEFVLGVVSRDALLLFRSDDDGRSWRAQPAMRGVANGGTTTFGLVPDRDGSELAAVLNVENRLISMYQRGDGEDPMYVDLGLESGRRGTVMEVYEGQRAWVFAASSDESELFAHLTTDLWRSWPMNVRLTESARGHLATSAERVLAYAPTGSGSSLYLDRIDSPPDLARVGGLSPAPSPQRGALVFLSDETLVHMASVDVPAGTLRMDLVAPGSGVLVTSARTLAMPATTLSARALRSRRGLVVVTESIGAIRASVQLF